jgi:uncharacterized protein (TIGR00299 family) protein
VERVLYIDCFCGASGDMLLGACLDAGLPLEALEQTISTLGLDVALAVQRVRRCGVEALKVTVVEPGGRVIDQEAPGTGQTAPGTRQPLASGHHRHLADILDLLDRARLPDRVRSRASGLFRRLAAVEAAVHGVPVEEVHFHEVGAADSIVDIVGTVFGLEWFGAKQIVASPLNTGSGLARGAHGVMPVPAPATTRLIEGVPVYADGPAAELLTPTGALLVTGYAVAYGPLPPMTIERTGYGAGTRDFPDRANVVRLVVGQPAAVGGTTRRTRPSATRERLLVLECEVDDLNPQVLGALMTHLLERGAHDVYYTALQMKKNRPGTLVTVLADPAGAEPLLDLLFAETTTLGVRVHEVERETLVREFHTVGTPYGRVRITVARRHGRIVNFAPEFDDCAALAAGTGVPIKDVLAAASHAWLNEASVPPPERGERGLP